MASRLDRYEITFPIHVFILYEAMHMPVVCNHKLIISIITCFCRNYTGKPDIHVSKKKE